jgi:hypothetical protein
VDATSHPWSRAVTKRARRRRARTKIAEKDQRLTESHSFSERAGRRVGRHQFLLRGEGFGAPTTRLFQ